MGRVWAHYLDRDEESEEIYCCKCCHTHLSSSKDIVSTNFQGLSGKAYLFDCVINVMTNGPVMEKMLMTGKHTVVDVYCNTCYACLGWKYLKAFQHTLKSFKIS